MNENDSKSVGYGVATILGILIFSLGVCNGSRYMYKSFFSAFIEVV